ncbi:class F sortase [Nonomuraea africana]|uniref:Sortase (Surface protein transpeptidase) n=1 Tax=Nonomuraea africana TaxID=46171 RepID=A0ABR9KUX9_9ACTN|nr:class F sortase [Nonomuraea africana]MBE1565838.1 sortase (surface protein transpeptidase) [Nonomuraea africana]
MSTRNTLAMGGAAVLLFSGGLAVAGSLRGEPAPAHARTVVASPIGAAHERPVFSQATAALPRSEPVSLSIPEIGVKDAPIEPVGLNPDQTVEVPPLSEPGLVGWYSHRPTPGEKGPAVLLGHVDGYGKPAVFHRAHTLKPGDTLTVKRKDASVATFTVDSLEQADKDAFPTERVYGATDSAELRLVTCGGAFDPTTGHYEDNIIIYAHLTPPT